MDHFDMLSHHRAVLDEIVRKRASLKAQLDELAVVERYHLHEIEMHNLLHGPAEHAHDIPTATANILDGKTLADACAAALTILGSGRANDVAECLQVAFRYGEGSANRSYINALYNAMARKPDAFSNDDGIWSLRSVPALESHRNRIGARPH
jgi:hypothetical protein